MSSFLSSNIYEPDNVFTGMVRRSMHGANVLKIESASPTRHCHALVSHGDFLYVAIRGSATRDDWYTNFKYMYNSDAFVGHEGFVRRSRLIPFRDYVSLAIQNQMGLILTGHSLGGALAEAGMIHNNIRNVLVVTFGQPTVYKEALCPVGSYCLRFVQKEDPVPFILGSFLDYPHNDYALTFSISRFPRIQATVLPDHEYQRICSSFKGQFTNSMKAISLGAFSGLVSIAGLTSPSILFLHLPDILSFFFSLNQGIVTHSSYGELIEYMTLQYLQRHNAVIEFSHSPQRDPIRLHHAKSVSIILLGLQSIPRGISWMINLVSLRIHDNHLTVLPDCIGHLVNLKLLRMGNNMLSALPDSLSNLKNLTRIGMGRNKLTSLPECIAGMTSLQKISAFGNQICFIHPNIGSLSQIQELNIAHNQLSEVPECIGRLTKLRSLEIFQNPITSLPKFISSLSALRVLQIEAGGVMSIQSVPSEITLLPCWKNRRKPREGASMDYAEALHRLTLV